MEETNLEYMIGTDGGKDYLIFARTGGSDLGIKVVSSIAPETGELWLGIRLRAVPNDANEMNGIEAADAWSNISFTKIDESRASIEVGISFEDRSPRTLAADFGDETWGQVTASHLLETLVSTETVMIPRSDLIEFLDAAMVSQMKEYTAYEDSRCGREFSAANTPYYTEAEIREAKIKAFNNMPRVDGETLH